MNGRMEEKKRRRETVTSSSAKDQHIAKSKRRPTYTAISKRSLRTRLLMRLELRTHSAEQSGLRREYHSIRSGASGLSYYCAPLVCVPDVIGLLTVWRHNKPKTKNQRKGVWGTYSFCFSQLFQEYSQQAVRRIRCGLSEEPTSFIPVIMNTRASLGSQVT